MQSCIFSDTIRSNLKYGNESATEAQLEKAVEMSRCLDMVKRLPQGYDTVLYGAGDNISQGQRQLFAIARAFVADPKILILDEATSSIDTRTERIAQRKNSDSYAENYAGAHKYCNCPPSVHNQRFRHDCCNGSW